MTTGNADGDPPIEIVVATDEGTVAAVNGATRTIEWRRDVGEFAAVHALGDGDGDGDPEVVAVTNDGTVSVVDPDSGAIKATYEREGEVPIYVHPTLANTDGDRAAEIYVTYGDGRVVSLSYVE